MDAEHVKELKNLLTTYGPVPIVQAMAEILEEDSKTYGEGAIIHQYLPIVKKASAYLEDTRMNRYLTFM